MGSVSKSFQALLSSLLSELLKIRGEKTQMCHLVQENTEENDDLSTLSEYA